jgi:hypothetical protein
MSVAQSRQRPIQTRRFFVIDTTGYQKSRKYPPSAQVAQAARFDMSAIRTRQNRWQLLAVLGSRIE